MRVFDVMWVPLHFEETSNPPQLDSFVGSCRSISFHRSSFFLYGTWIRCLHLGLCFWCLVQVIPILMVGDARIRIVPVCRTSKDHCSPPMVPIWNLSTQFQVWARSSWTQPNCDFSWSRFGCLIWSRLIWSSTSVFLLSVSRIISITATRVNVGFAMFGSFRVGTIFDSAASIWG